MYIMLQQLDITLNQSFNPYFNNSFDDESKQKFIKHLYNKIDRRCEQLDYLKRLINEELSDEEFYSLASKAYYFTYKSQKFIKSNILLDINHDYLMINIRINSPLEIDHNKNYSIFEIENLFKNEKVLYEEVFISEDNDIKDTTNYMVCSDKEFSYYYNRLNGLRNIVSIKNINEVRKLLTKDRIRKDYDRLLKQTEDELKFLSNRFNEDIKLEL